MTGAGGILGGTSVYPFERFTERAKKTLTFAQEEAERSRHSYIGTEHILLGLLREQEGDAAEVLKELRIDIATVRQTIASVVGRTERIIIQQIIPTSRVKQVIEIAFDEARRMGHDSVDTGHLLMALVIEGEGIAAHVLEDMGARANVVVAELEKRWGLQPSGMGKRSQPKKMRFPALPRMRLAQMRTVAGFKPVPPAASDTETLHRLLTTPQFADLMRRRGFDVDRLVNELAKPPDQVVKLRADLAVARSHLADAVGQADYERAAQVQKTLNALSGRLKAAEHVWLKSISG
ncbi:MAG TPA: Clp protease N-terminal domain-containing protein [Candidatus Limnocylindrales bacterium]|nr:Clp protease N-terminal domain-containing protein [Candidatus Limnocylindrales bacterium]